MTWIDDYLARPPVQPYDDYVDPTMPTRAQFSSDAAYDQAMVDWAYNRNGAAPAFAPPTATPYARPDGSTGMWYTAGTTRQETPGEYWANYLNNKWLAVGGQPHGLDYIGLQSWLGLHPDEAKAAIMAVGPDGVPLMERGLIDFLLSHGVVMPSRDPGQVIGEPASGGNQPPVVTQGDPTHGSGLMDDYRNQPPAPVAPPASGPVPGLGSPGGGGFQNGPPGIAPGAGSSGGAPVPVAPAPPGIGYPGSGAPGTAPGYGFIPPQAQQVQQVQGVAGASPPIATAASAMNNPTRAALEAWFARRRRAKFGPRAT